MVIAVFVRRLREGKTYADFREAWRAEKGFGVPTRVVNAQRVDDEREIISIGFVDIAPEDLAADAERVADREQVRHDRISEVIEPGSTRRGCSQLSALWAVNCEHPRPGWRYPARLAR